MKHEAGTPDPPGTLAPREALLRPRTAGMFERPPGNTMQVGPTTIIDTFAEAFRTSSRFAGIAQLARELLEECRPVGYTDSQREMG